MGTRRRRRPRGLDREPLLKTAAILLLVGLTLIPVPATSAGTVPGPVCSTPTPGPNVPTFLPIPPPYPTVVTPQPNGCPPPMDLVASATPQCPLVGTSAVLPGEYCGKLYLPGQTVFVTVTWTYPAPVANRDWVVAGFDMPPYDGHLNPGEPVCDWPTVGPGPVRTASTSCMVPPAPGNLAPGRLIAWMTCAEIMPLAVVLGYLPAGIGVGP